MDILQGAPFPYSGRDEKKSVIPFILAVQIQGYGQTAQCPDKHGRFKSMDIKVWALICCFYVICLIVQGGKGRAESSNGTIFCCFWFKDSIDRKNPGFISFGGFDVQFGEVIFRQELPCQTAKSNIFHSAYGGNTDKMRIRRAKQKPQTTLNQLIGIFPGTQSRI